MQATLPQLGPNTPGESWLWASPAVRAGVAELDRSTEMLDAEIVEYAASKSEADPNGLVTAKNGVTALNVATAVAITRLATRLRRELAKKVKAALKH